MTLYKKIIETYPELELSNEFLKGLIALRNDSDDAGDYIEKWEYSESIPTGLKLGKPKS